MTNHTRLAFTAVFAGLFSACGNDDPAANNPPMTSDVDLVVSGDTVATVTLKATDSNQDQLPFVVTAMPQHGSLGPLVEAGPGSVEVAYTPEPGYHGTDRFSFEVTDSAGDSASGTVSIVVNNGDPGYTDRIKLARLCDVPNGPLTGPPWPSLLLDAYDPAIVSTARERYFAKGIDHTPRLRIYDPLGDYLSYGQVVNHRESDLIAFDDAGVPMIRYGTEFQYNAVTVAEYALAEYGRYLAGTKPVDGLLAGAERLLALQDERGALLYAGSWHHYLLSEAYAPGWTSAMAQGMALSVFYRAYSVTGDPRYIEAGNAALSYLDTPVGEGGVKDSLSSLGHGLETYAILEEWLGDPAIYTLNGFMFAMLGLHDWTATDGAPAELAKVLFDRSMETLVAILPYYELGGFSAYDLGHLTYGAEPHIGIGYHAWHIALLHALESITGDKCLAHTEEMWATHVAAP